MVHDSSSNVQRKKYRPDQIEEKWRKIWDEQNLYKFSFDTEKDYYYTLVELPYPSGDLHIGHWFTFANADAHARYQKMVGKNVFFPNGFDAFGLPAENAAIKRNIHPKDWTMANIENMKKQFNTMGSMIDWSHTAITCLPEYYRWNQWIFLQLYEKGIAYRGKALSNWCPVDQTVLANEHVEDGKCWRCGSEVEQKEVAQWFLRITTFADELEWPEPDVNGLSNGVDWPQSVREGQNNWIGRSEGAVIDFDLLDNTGKITVFTTRPDTLFGATFMVIAPEHEISMKIVNGDFHVDDTVQKEVVSYVSQARKKTERERKEDAGEKTGIFSGVYAKHPITNEKIPVWIADYVLATYGTGAIMAVPAHDARDFVFAKKFDLHIKSVIKLTIRHPREGEDQKILSQAENDSLDEAYVGPGTLVNSQEWDGLEVPREIGKTIDWLEERGIGKKKVQYHLRDWSISRQRYWGTPVPIIYCHNCWESKEQMASILQAQDKNGKSFEGKDFVDIEGERYAIIPVSEKELPVEIPYEVDYQPKGKPPLATATNWVTVECPKCGKTAKRDTETLDTFFDSSWYFYRYVSPEYSKGPFDPKEVATLMPLDIYFGGAEHTLGHTLYARFFTKFFKELGLVDFDEFAKKRIQHGIILGPDGYRMSKSRGNVINPDDVVKDYGTDAVRLYLGFMMPFEATAPWNTSAISGVYRFLKRVWDLSFNIVDVAPDTDDQVIMQKTIKKVGEDLEQIKFNTAVASLMEWLNHLSRKESVSPIEFKTLLLLLAPMAPHITEELWQTFMIQDSGFKNKERNSNHMFDSIHNQTWPEFDESILSLETLTVIVQVNGKLRDTLQIEARELTQDEVEKLAKESEKVKRHLTGMTIKKIIYIPQRAINFVLG